MFATSSFKQLQTTNVTDKQEEKHKKLPFSIPVPSLDLAGQTERLIT